jgi:hypothetical protein
LDNTISLVDKHIYSRHTATNPSNVKYYDPKAIIHTLNHTEYYINHKFDLTYRVTVDTPVYDGAISFKFIEDRAKSQFAEKLYGELYSDVRELEFILFFEDPHTETNRRKLEIIRRLKERLSGV